MRRAKYGFGCVVSLAAVALMGVLTGPAMQVKAQWQPHQIKVGDGQGGSISLPAYRQEIRVPGGIRTLPLGLAQMDNGQVAMVVAWGTGGGYYPKITFSSDAGNTWSDFQALPTEQSGSYSWPLALTYLGGGNLSYASGDKRYFSNDYGQTWPESVVRQPISGRTDVGIEGSTGVDRDASGNATRVMEINYYWPNGSMVGWPHDSGTDTFFRYSEDGGRTWQGDILSPNWKYTETYKGTTYNRGTSEGSVIRAANGWLVAALRTDMPPRFFVDPGGFNDNLEGTGVSISQDNGQTWSELNILFEAGRHHADLRRLPNGDLVMTTNVRNDIRSGGGLDSHMRGFDALMSHDNGLTWNLDRRITLDEFEYYNPAMWYDGKCGHLGATVLDDGSVLAAYGGKYTTGAAVLVKWNPATVPEPSTVVLLVSGLLALLCYAWRRRK